MPEEAATLLEKWGKLAKKGEIAVYSIESGEIRVRKVAEGPTYSARRIHVQPTCGCVLELEELRDFEQMRVSYRVVAKKLCKEHQA